MDKVKLVIYVPKSHSEVVRQALGDAGAGRIGNYAFCSYSVTGVGRFQPTKGAKPAIGEVGKLEEVEEERIESECSADMAKEVIAAVKKVHPYDEMVVDVYPLLSMDELRTLIVT